MEYTIAGHTFDDRINITVVGLDVDWETYPDNVPANPDHGPNIEIDNIGGGKRIFPGKKVYDDTSEEAAMRRKVRVKATVTPAVDNRHVYFSVWDVDDPSPSPIIDTFDKPAGPSGPDNYGKRGDENAYLSSTNAVTDGSGIARTTFIVSMNPGDNFKMAASIKQTRLSQMTQEKADGLEPLPDSVVLSPLLTVWRKLHLELDSMEAGQDNPVSNRNIDETWNNTPHTGESGAEINGWDPDLDEGQYEGGTLTVASAAFQIIDNIDDWGDDTVYVIGDICPYEDNLASFGDDDICPLPRKANWSLMNGKFNPAYVEAVEEPGVYDSNATFAANIIGFSVADPVRNRITASDYWMAQIMSCHQGQRSTDGDADTVYHWHGFTSYKTGDTGVLVGQTSSNSNVSVIYLESIRDRADQEPFLVSIEILSAAYSATDIEETTVVHEVGHIFGCEHSDGGIMQSGVENPALDFSDVSISRIRSSNP